MSKKAFSSLQIEQISRQEITTSKVQQQLKIKDKKSLVYKIQQQLMAAWQPVPSYTSSIILFIILTIFFIAVGVIMFIFTSQEKKIEIRYDDKCANEQNCSVTFELKQQMHPPIYIYYGLTNFNQNNRFFTTSKSEAQLQRGQIISQSDARQTCGSKTTNAQMKWVTSKDNTTTLDENTVAFPCGHIANSFFTDEFQLKTSNTNLISISSQGIALPYDKNFYKNVNLSKQGIDLNNERFLVWMRPAATSSFYKLWGIIHQTLLIDNYTIVIQNEYDVSFSQKWIKLSKSNVFGDKNTVLAIAYFVCGGASLIILLGFLIGKIAHQCQYK